MSMRRLLSSVAVVGVPVLVSALVVFAQQSATQQKCLNGINKDGANVAKAQGKENAHCLKDAGNAKIPPGTAQSCLTADARGKVQKKENKTTAVEAATCNPAPSFGFAGAASANTAGVQREVALMGDVFGGDLDAAVISCGTNKPGCKCQQKILGVVEKLADVKLGLFVKCKKAVLKNGANSDAALEACVNDGGTPGSIAADTTGKIAKTVVKLDDAITKKCDTPGVTAGAFPGNCTGSSGNTLGTCLDTQVECRVCQFLNQTDALAVDCDLFDDGAADASCGAVPTPTPTATVPAPTPTATPTATPTPTATATCAPGFAYNGALVPTVGRFNYNLTLGLPGANNACNSNFAGSHVCTFFELQCAQTAGSLVGAVDTSAAAVGSYWVIDPLAAGKDQCFDDGTGGSLLNWQYGTAHTISRGERVTLNNGTGVLGSACTLISNNCGTCIGGTNNGAVCSAHSVCPGGGACSGICQNGTCITTGLQCNFSGNSNVGCCH